MKTSVMLAIFVAAITTRFTGFITFGFLAGIAAAYLLKNRNF
mgnify:CR=1 FL=1